MRALLQRRGIKTAVATLGLSLGLVACSSADNGSEEGSADAAQVEETEIEQGPVNVYLTRHTETMLNALHRVQGWSDAPLTDQGVTEAEALGEGFNEHGVDFDAAFTADTSRQFETAKRALESSGSDIEPIRDEDLREIAFGAFEADLNSNMMDQVAEEFGYEDEGDLYAHMGEVGFVKATDAVADVAPESDLELETSEDIIDRVLPKLEEIAIDQQEAGNEDVLVVSSMISIMVILDELGVDLAEIPELQNGAVNKLVYDDGEWTVESYNDVSYMDLEDDDE